MTATSCYRGRVFTCTFNDQREGQQAVTAKLVGEGHFINSGSDESVTAKHIAFTGLGTFLYYIQISNGQVQRQKGVTGGSAGDSYDLASQVGYCDPF